MKMCKVLFVCLGNICRSPSAEAILKKRVKDAGLEHKIVVDSAGLLDYHEGELPDPRMRQHASLRGYTLDSRSRPIETKDFFDFDWIIGMDDQIVDALKRHAPDVKSLGKIHKMTDLLPDKRYDRVPDPYYGGSSGFELVLDILEDTCQGLFETLCSLCPNN
jgi:protein-tyrosine phosphatase